VAAPPHPAARAGCCPRPDLAARRATLARHRQAELEPLDRLQRRIDHATTGLGRITNRHIVTDLRDEYDARTVALDRLDRQLEELDVEGAGLPTGEQITQLQGQWCSASGFVTAFGMRNSPHREGL
jgi:hypothetical protein